MDDYAPRFVMKAKHRNTCHSQPRPRPSAPPQAPQAYTVLAMRIALAPKSVASEPKLFPLFPRLPAEIRLKIYTYMLALTLTSHAHTRILRISFSPSSGTYISNTRAPVTLSLNAESRIHTLATHTYLSLGPIPRTTTLAAVTSPFSPYTIPICFPSTTLYISNLGPIIATHFHDIRYHLSTSPARHLIQSLAVDFRVWAELCEHGFLSCVASMRALRELCLVVEFGRAFEGELGFLSVPAWRRDLDFVAETAEMRVKEMREKVGGGSDAAESAARRLRMMGLVVAGEEGVAGTSGSGGLGEVEVRCVLLTRGGEQS